MMSVFPSGVNEGANRYRAMVSVQSDVLRTGTNGFAAKEESLLVLRIQDHSRPLVTRVCLTYAAGSST